MPFRPIALLCLAGCALTAAFAPSRVAPRSTITMGPLDNLKSFKLPAKGASAPAPVEVKSAASKKTKTVAIKAKAAPKKVKAAPAPKASAAVAAPPKAKKAFSVPSFSLSAPSAPARRGPVRATNTKKGNFRQVGGAGYTIGDVSKLQATFCFVPQKEYLDSKPRVEFWEAIRDRRAAIAAQKPPPSGPKGPVRSINLKKGLTIRSVGNAESFAGTKMPGAVTLVEKQTGVKVPRVDLPKIDAEAAVGGVLATVSGNLPKPPLLLRGIASGKLPDLPYLSNADTLVGDLTGAANGAFDQAQPGAGNK